MAPGLDRIRKLAAQQEAGKHVERKCVTPQAHGHNNKYMFSA